MLEDREGPQNEGEHDETQGRNQYNQRRRLDLVHSQAIGRVDEPSDHVQSHRDKRSLRRNRIRSKADNL